MTISEILGRIDKNCFESDTKVYDLRGLYESVTLNSQDKQELKKLIDSVDNSEEGVSVIAAYLQTKENKNESFDETPICEECGEPLKLNPGTGSYFCPTCEQYLVENSMDRNSFINEDFWFEYNGKAYEAWYLDFYEEDFEEYAIMEFPDWDSADDKDNAEPIFTVYGDVTVGEVIDMIKGYNEDEDYAFELSKTLY